MAHVRQSIRDNVVTAVTGLSTTGSNVFRLVMIRDIVSSESKFPPIVHAQALCIDKDDTKKKPSAIDKPQKPKVPEEKV